MMTRVKWWSSRLVVALGYVAGLLLATAVLNSRDDATRRAWVAWTSTNLTNLRHHPVPSLVTSAFVIEDGDPSGWAVLAAAGLVALAWRLGVWRTLAVVGAAHVLGTLISEGVVAWRIHQGALPAAARDLVDVGPSYVVVAALVGAVAVGPWPARLVGAGGFAVLAPSLFGGLTEFEVAAVGHVCSIVIGAGLGLALRPRVPRAVSREP
jgi:hypothetical protein